VPGITAEAGSGSSCRRVKCLERPVAADLCIRVAASERAAGGHAARGSAANAKLLGNGVKRLRLIGGSSARLHTKHASQESGPALTN